MMNFEHPSVSMRKYFINKYGLTAMKELEKAYLNRIDRATYKDDCDAGFKLWANAYNRQCPIAVSIIVDYEEAIIRERN
tara:strand:+ start:346 stop:582 length:237 start_codon:yes stop_codon:yes gene_type:complete